MQKVSKAMTATLAAGSLPIVIQSWHTPESSGGFFWAVDTPENRDAFLESHQNDLKDFNSSVVLTIGVSAFLSREEITDLIDYELLDLIEQKQIGKILHAS